MNDQVVLQYIGFQTKDDAREYAFTLRVSGNEYAEYFVAIANAAFIAHRVRYQDAPDICSLRLHREFADKTAHPPSTRFSITDAELADYLSSHAAKAKSGPRAQMREDQS